MNNIGSAFFAPPTLLQPSSHIIDNCFDYGYQHLPLPPPPPSSLPLPISSSSSSSSSSEGISIQNFNSYCNLNNSQNFHLQQPPPPPVSIGYSEAMSLYNTEQLETICTSLFQARDGDRLVAVFQQIDRAEVYKSEPILVAFIYALYHANEFDQLFTILSTRAFNSQHFNDLQEIWHNARYKESQLKRGKELNPVEKYRLRRKFPPPKTIWDGEETVYSFKENSRKYLKQFYKQNQYPSQEQKREISKATNLKIIQISNWFKNRRQRDKPQSKGSPDSSSSSSGGHHPNDYMTVNAGVGPSILPTTSTSSSLTSSSSHLISTQHFNVHAAAAAAAYGTLPLNVGMFYDTTRI